MRRKLKKCLLKRKEYPLFPLRILKLLCVKNSANHYFMNQ